MIGYEGPAESVVLVDDEANPIGTADKATVHTTDTPLHLAFSCHLLDEQGRVLLTRRALSKRAWPGVWTNAFCGHPGPGEVFASAIDRRAEYELGIAVEHLQPRLPDFRYRAVDDSGVVENEICPVFSARIVGVAEAVTPNPGEVCAHAWADPTAVGAAVRGAPFAFSPWFVDHVRLMPDLYGQ